MINTDDMRGLYRATLDVVPASAGSRFDYTVLIVADSFGEAQEAAEPAIGHYSYELISLKRIGEVVVTPRRLY